MLLNENKCLAYLENTFVWEQIKIVVHVSSVWDIVINLDYSVSNDCIILVGKWTLKKKSGLIAIRMHAHLLHSLIAIVIVISAVSVLYL